MFTLIRRSQPPLSAAVYSAAHWAPCRAPRKRGRRAMCRRKGHHGSIRPPRVRPHLDQQRQGPGRLRARPGARLVHDGYGILNEVYSPRVDIPQIRDLGFIVADGQGFWVEVKRHEPLPHAGAACRRPGARNPACARAFRASAEDRARPAARGHPARSDAAGRRRPSALRAAGAASGRHRDTTTSPNRPDTGAAASCGPSRARSDSRWRRPTAGKAMRGAPPASAMSAPATAGRTSAPTVG